MKKEAIRPSKLAIAIALAVLLVPFSFAELYFPDTKVYGLVLDKNGNRIENEWITALWSDSYGNHSVQTKTLTKKEAQSINNPDLWGAYIFSNGIKAAPGTKITIQTQPKAIYEVVVSTPGQIIKAQDMVLPLTIEPEVEEQDKEDSRMFMDFLGKIFWLLKKLVKPIIFLIVGLILWHFIPILYKRVRNIRISARKQFSNEVYRIGSRKIKTMMKKNVITCNKEFGVMEALEIMITKDVNSLIIVYKKEPVGIISECDFLKKVYTRDKIEPLKAQDIMSFPLKTVTPDTTFFECIEFALKNNIRRLPVVSGKKLDGIVTVSDMLRYFHDFFSEKVLEGDFPIAKDIMTNEVSEISDEARISDVLSFMIWKKTSYLIPKSDKIGKIVTSGDALNQFYKSLNEMYKMKLKQISSQEIVFVSPFANILQVLEMMKKNDYKRLPVVSDNKVIGVITQISMLKSVYAFLKQIQTTK